MKSNRRKSVLVNDGERMVPEYHKKNLFYAEHMTRYEITAELVRNKVILDIASGSGYGTQIIARGARRVYGVDVSPEAIAYAAEHYPAKNIEYIQGDGEQIPLADKTVDVVVSFETIEHIRDYDKFLDEVARVLKDDGIAIISTPNDLEYAEGNHFHLHEFIYSELSTLLKQRFRHVSPCFQSTWRAVLTGPLVSHTDDVINEIKVKNYDPLIGPDKTLYFYMICSNQPIHAEVTPMLGLGVHLSEAADFKKELELQGRLSHLQQSSEEQATRLEELKTVLEDERKLADRIRISRYLKYYFIHKLSQGKRFLRGTGR